MDRVTNPGRAVSLVLELGSGTAVVDGERIALPAKELKLLTVLAARPGEAVARSELRDGVWPEAPWMTDHDLYWHVSQLRRDLGGSERVRNMIRNRRGFGYFLDLPPEEVVLVEGAGPDLEARPVTIRLDEVEAEAEPTEVSSAQPPVTASEPEGRRLRIPRLASAAILVIGLIAASWSAGFLLSKGRPTPSVAPGSPPLKEHQEQAQKEPRSQPPRDDRSQKRGDKRDQGGDRAGGAPAAGSAGSTDDGSAALFRPARQRSRESGKSDSAQPSLPPAPTRYLYHLVDAETGDHFVTTDGGVTSEYEAKGYEGAAIARVYTYKEDNTKAVATNYGTAYIFIARSPKTEPVSTTVPLWYATNNAGDFFYTTSKSEASYGGWTPTLIGYARTLS